MYKLSTMRVPLLDLKAQYEVIAQEIEVAVREVFDSQHFILGPQVRDFEQEIASYCGSLHCVGCASGSDALLLALMAYKIVPGDEVITTPFTFFATGGSIVRLGARPVFVDIEPHTFNMDAMAVEDAITERTKAIIPVHLFGQCADMDVICEVAGRKGIAVIEDAAQAIGAEYKGRRAGGLGSMAAFSFYPSKNLGGFGDGGAITTSDPDLADRLRRYRAHGARNKYFHEDVGINSRLDSLQAAILRVKLRHLEEWNERRRGNAERYIRLFEQSGLFDGGYVALPGENGCCRHVYNQFVLRLKKRDEVRHYLAERGIGTEVYYPLPLHLQECFKDLGYRHGDFVVSEKAAGEVLAIPIYPELDESAQEYVVGIISSFYKLM